MGASTAWSTEPGPPRGPDAEAADRRLAGLAALAVTIHLLEAAVPSPVPGLKPGLANVVTLVVLLRWGIAAAVWVSALRVVAGSLFIGSFLTPTFFLSASGAAASAAILAAVYPLVGGRLSAVGYGLLAAQAHIAAQFLVAYTLFLPHPAILALLPVLATAALVTGATGGILANMILAKLSLSPMGPGERPEDGASPTSAGRDRR